jgi:AcrR family transcriptional regulator
MRVTSEATGPRARTRRAILDAAIDVFAKRPSASLGDVADAAGVGRSTLHRYFPDRTALVDALFDDTIEAMQHSFDEAALDQGTPTEALRRLVRAFFELGPQLTFLFSELGDEQWDNQALERAQWPVAALFVRGQAQGDFDPEFSIEWIIRVLWHLMPAGWEAIEEGEMRKHEAIANLTRTMENCLRVQPTTLGP